MYQAGIYCRISIEEQKKEDKYSISINSQIQMARNYIANQGDIVEVKVYADDGASGSNFDRTEFRRMLADIELGVKAVEYFIRTGEFYPGIDWLHES